MKNTVIAVVLVTLIFGFGFWYQSRPESVERNLSSEQVGGQKRTSASSADQGFSAALTNAENIAAVPQGPMPGDGAVIREWGDFIPAKDIRVKCRDVPQVINSDLSGGEIDKRCGELTVFGHPYVFFTEEQLKQIADYDAEAAYLLAYRILLGSGTDRSSIANLEMGLTYAMKALVQSWEKQAFDLLIDGRSFGNGVVWATTNGIPTTDQVQERAEEYVWYKTGRNLGFIAEDDFHWQELLREWQVPDAV